MKQLAFPSTFPFVHLLGATVFSLGVAAVSLTSSVTEAKAEQTIIKIDGSSTVYPISEAAAEEFQQREKGKIQVTIGISGTGGGFKKFTRGEIDVSDASRPISAAEIEEAKKNGIEFVELPIAYDALTVVIHPDNKWAEKLTVDELKRIWQPEAQGKVLLWSQVRPGFPEAPLKLYGAGSDSGTFDYFTEAVVGKAKSSRGDYTASEDDNVLVQGVTSDKNALGYFGYSYYVENKDKLHAVAIDNGKGAAVLPSADNVLNSSYQPLSRPIFIYVNKASLARPEVTSFVRFYLENAERLVKEVKYIPLSDSAYKKCLTRVEKMETGSVFGGSSHIGVSMDKLFEVTPTK